MIKEQKRREENKQISNVRKDFSDDLRFYYGIGFLLK